MPILPVGSVVYLVEYGLLNFHHGTVNLEVVVFQRDAAEVITGEALLVQIHGTKGRCLIIIHQTEGRGEHGIARRELCGVGCKGVDGGDDGGGVEGTIVSGGGGEDVSAERFDGGEEGGCVAGAGVGATEVGLGRGAGCVGGGDAT